MSGVTSELVLKDMASLWFPEGRLYGENISHGD